MARLAVFNQVTLDGYFADQRGDMSWAHKARDDAEWNAFVSENASGGGMLLFGRVTYDLMIRYWPTPQAHQNDPVVADGMNRLPKVVFSKTLTQASWSNTRLVRTDPAEEVRRLKQASGPDMAILGSGTIVSQLAQAGLIDAFQIVVNPILLGRGRGMFETLKGRLDLKLESTRSFRNGNVMLTYGPAA
jgi:dihydrofolate reductase